MTSTVVRGVLLLCEAVGDDGTVVGGRVPSGLPGRLLSPVYERPFDVRQSDVVSSVRETFATATVARRFDAGLGVARAETAPRGDRSIRKLPPDVPVRFPAARRGRLRLASVLGPSPAAGRPGVATRRRRLFLTSNDGGVVSETAVVAGVGPTIGEAVAREFHDAGMDVGLFARSAEFIEALADDLGDGALAVPVDVTDEAAVREGVETVRERFGPVSVLVANASAGGGRPVEDAAVARLRSIFDVRVAGTLACVQAALADLRTTSGTVIVSGTTYATPPVVEQLEWGAVGPAARGLSVSLDAALDTVQVTYVRIGTAVRPSGESGPTSVDADDVAAEYRHLVERGAVGPREVDLRRRASPD